jgi:N-methylhydantoinase A
VRSSHRTSLRYCLRFAAVNARIGIDTGGTFTDAVRWSQDRLVVHKVPSTPDDPGRAVLAALAALRQSADESVDVVHGTTVGLNAVLTGNLARTAFVTNTGFEDLIEIGRQERTELHALEPSRPAPPVPRLLRLGVRCRRAADGSVVTPLTGGEIETLVRRLRALRPAAVAVGLLHSPADARDELRIAKAIRGALPAAHVTCSAELWPAPGEYERFTAAILNAAIGPRVGSYTGRLAADVRPGRLRLMRSSLGILPAGEAAEFPARAMFSGPAGGVLATLRTVEAARWSCAAAFDMGGTSTDVCLVRGTDLLTDHGRIGGLPLPLPAVAVHTVGCGGGSIAYRDAGGALRVGPESAGADPGPACYGRGDEPTVTDAHMVLGHMGERTLLGGSFPVDVAASARAIGRLARRLGLSPARTATGILEVAEAAMARALMVITAEQAVDPSSVPLVAYGGAGGLHAGGIAQRLGMPVALVPPHPGAFSALGLALAGESLERCEACEELLDDRSERRLRQRAGELGRELASSLRTAHGGQPRITATMLLRYRGQGGGLLVPLRRSSPTRAFSTLHETRFGFVVEGEPIEAVQISVRAELPGRSLPQLSRPGLAEERKTPLARRRRCPLQSTDLWVYDRAEMPIGSRFSGPCLVEEPTGVTLVQQGTKGIVTHLGIELRRSKP